MSKITYCSIQEAWGYNEYEENPLLENNQQSFDNQGQLENREGKLENREGQLENREGQLENREEENTIRMLEKKIEYLENKYNELLNKKKINLVENFGNLNNKKTDLFILIFFGIIVIYIIDQIVNIS